MSLVSFLFYFTCSLFICADFVNKEGSGEMRRKSGKLRNLFQIQEWDVEERSE